MAVYLLRLLATVQQVPRVLTQVEVENGWSEWDSRQGESRKAESRKGETRKDETRRGESRKSKIEIETGNLTIENQTEISGES